MLEIDGAYGEGGGQLVRTAVALSAVTGTPIRVTAIRARRDRPGLAYQHVAAVRAVAELCSAAVNGLELRSREITFRPGCLRGGRYRFDVGTAGSVTLVLQALLPVLLACGGPSKVTVIGGTDVRMAPPLDYLREVLLAHVHRLGAAARLATVRRGYYPRGGGEVALSVLPAKLRPAPFATPGALREIAGNAHVASLPASIADRMRDAALARLAAVPHVRAEIAAKALGPDEAIGPGGAIVVWARAGHAVLGAGRVAERGVRAETLGEAVGDEIAADLAAGAGVDVHAADQLLVYLALAGGGSLTTRALSSHARTAIWLIERFLPVRFDVATAGALTHVEVRAR